MESAQKREWSPPPEKGGCRQSGGTSRRRWFELILGESGSSWQFEPGRRQEEHCRRRPGKC